MAEQDIPEARVASPQVGRRHSRVLLVWLVPIVAALVGIGLVIRAMLAAGPTITVSFETAEGLQAGKTEVKYKNVVVGRVTSIRLTPNFKGVVATIDLTHNAARLAVADTRFWVVRPRVDWGGVSGLNTLLSGAYIGVDVGSSKTPKRRFIGLGDPPAILHDQKGRRFLLHARTLGSLNIGSKIYYRKLAVGRVAGYKLDSDGQGVTIQLFVRAPYDRFVKRDTHFWNASGVDLAVNANGLKLATESVASVLAGGVGFGLPSGVKTSQPAPQDTRFDLYDNRADALAPPNGPGRQIRMQFHQSIRGLSIGSPIDFRGIDLGHVTAIHLEYDPKQVQFTAEVLAEVYPQRLGPAYQTLRKLHQSSGPGEARLLAALVKKGLRAQLRYGNLLTGQLYISLDFVNHPHPVKFDTDQQPYEIPTTRGSLQQIQTQIADVVRKLDAVPYARIGNHLDHTLRSTQQLLDQLRTQLAPQATRTLDQAQKTLDAARTSLISPRAPLQQNASRTLIELDRAARSLRSLADYLRRHPQSLLRGTAPDAPPPNAEDSR